MRIKLFLTLFALLLLSSCRNRGGQLNISFTNPIPMERIGEMAELSIDELLEHSDISDTTALVLLDAAGNPVPYQITYDRKLIFPVTLGAGETVSYTLKSGISNPPVTKVCGRVYPKRMDDLAWENDLVGFRAYGPALQARGERGFGYDLFTKRGTDLPVLEEMYALETDKETWDKIYELKKTNFSASEELRKSITYHVDHGYGMDCYAVGPTLGAGVAALYQNDSIVYPWCYKECEILDNGPLRFTARLKFTPLVVDGDSIVETRVLTLDLGSHLNRTSVSYTSLKTATPIVAGMALHDTVGKIKLAVEDGFITYEDPTTGPGQGKIFVGLAFPGDIKEAKIHEGHALAFSEYIPESEFTYYWGFAWSHADITTIETWDEYMYQFVQKLRNPFIIKIQ